MKSPSPASQDKAAAIVRHWRPIAVGFIAWYVLSGLYYGNFASTFASPTCGLEALIFYAFGLALYVVILIVVFIFKRSRWVAPGVFIAHVTNIALILVTSYMPGCPLDGFGIVPFFIRFL